MMTWTEHECRLNIAIAGKRWLSVGPIEYECLGEIVKAMKAFEWNSSHKHLYFPPSMWKAYPNDIQGLLR